MVTQHTRGTKFVGRRVQLELLAARLRCAEQSEGSIVIVAGEAGAGKTRLLTEFCNSLPQETTSWAVGRCLEYIQLPYAPLLAVLGRLVVANSSVLAGVAHVRDALAHLVPELGPASQTPGSQVPDKLRQFNAMAEAFQLLGRERLTVAVVEDLHWADSGTLEMLLHVLPFIASSRVLLILTHRSEMPRDHPLRSILAKLERDRAVFRTDLEPLESAQMHSLVLHAVKNRKGLPPGVINAICVKAEGNPLFAEELLKAACSGVVHLDQRLPSTLKEAVRERFRGLNEAERAALTCGAAIGRKFRADFLAELVGQTVEQIGPALRHGLDLELIEEARNGDVYYTFKHELLRQAIYGELLAAEARPLHARIARALEADSADEHVVELAYHWWQAREPNKAAHYNELAGDAAFAIFAYDDAAVNYERALKAQTAQGAHRAELSLKLSRALHQTGSGEHAKDAALAALAFYESDDKERAAEICLHLAQLSFDLSDEAAVGPFAERALALIDANPDNPLFFAAHVELMALNTHPWDPQKARYHMNQAERFRGTPETNAKIRFLQSKTAIEACTGNPDVALDQTRLGAQLASQSGDVRSALRIWDNFATGMADIGEREYALQGFDQAFEIVARNNVAGLSAHWLSLDFAHANLRFGDLRTAHELVEKALGARIDLTAFRLFTAEAGILIGLWLEIDDLIERCMQPDLLDFALRSSDAAAINATASFAEWHAVEGHIHEAQSLLRHAASAYDAVKSRLGPGDVYKLLVSMAAHGGQEDAERAGELGKQIADTLNVRSVPAYSALIDAYVQVRKLGGSKDAAITRALEAAVLFHELGWPVYEARSLELAGKLNEALEIYRRIGDLRDTHRLEAELTPPTRGGRAAGELTAREREILSLVVTGKSNRAIAEALVISERTVENHVSSILAKTNVSSRAELIAKRKGDNP